MDLQPPKGGEAGLRAVAQHGGYPPPRRGEGTGRGTRPDPQGQAALSPRGSPGGEEAPCPVSHPLRFPWGRKPKTR